MAERKGFDLGAALRAAVPDSGTGDKDRIVRFDVDAIEPDPKNFYRISGIEELMASIELVGLQQPLLVRQHPDKAAAVMIVSGHRRREAIKRLVDEGREDLRMVPCIMESAGGSAALDELRLIYANCSTRHLTGAEISSQAQRVEALLYELKEQGFEFPGRMRDHVAEACKVSKSKLARLKVIRDNLIAPWASRWKKKEISEATAYRLSQCTPEHQQILFDKFGSSKCFYETDADTYDTRLNTIEALQCKKCGGACANAERMKAKALSLDHWAYFPCSKCCDKCDLLASCKRACPEFLDKIKRLKADAKAKAAQEKGAREDAERQAIEATFNILSRWDAARTQAKKTVKETFEAAGKYYHANDNTYIAEQLTGRRKLSPQTILPFGNWQDYSAFNGLIRTADFLGVTTDFLLGRSDDMREKPAATPEPAPQFRPGKEPPTEKTLAWCAFIVDGHELTTSAVWWPHLGKWCFEHGAGIDAECVGWIPLPDWKGVLRDKEGGEPE